jgi:polysaccharide pyruvyl transferase WcaK-like protein
MPNFYRPFYRIAIFAAAVRTPMSLMAIGVGPVRTGAAGIYYRRLASLARYVCVRDEQSRSRLKEAGVMSCVDVVDDPVFWRNMRVGEQSTPRYDLAINLRCWNDFGVRRIRNLAGGLDSIVEACALAINGYYGRDARIALVSMSNHPDDNDAEPLAQLAAMLDARTDEFFDARAAEARIVISNSAGVLAMRLHAALLGVAANRPVTAIGYDAKIAQQAARFGFTAVELNGHFNSSQLALRLPPNGDTARKRDPVMPPPIFGNNGGFA